MSVYIVHMSAKRGEDDYVVAQLMSSIQNGGAKCTLMHVGQFETTWYITWSNKADMANA
eukprot:CAMPEP_0172630924 /NCGR_PEP_ID=MMETSP1068-20121228/176347_1 /TAXON_ID=35684 /ORGANISM="Pseudopedinella elastica, Strain CCMP716" /LENGTH=58 /DNA_ID=CAMNT_0013441913 /DNA_START=32 /DNA_END=205 /DNA_ORIENTATION=-